MLILLQGVVRYVWGFIFWFGLIFAGMASIQLAIGDEYWSYTNGSPIETFMVENGSALMLILGLVVSGLSLSVIWRKAVRGQL